MTKVQHSLSPAIILIVLVITFLLHLNPFSLWMPDMIGMLIVSIFCITVAVYTALFWRETPRDERELLHIHIADRYAFIAANIVLIAGLIVSMLTHTQDVWLIVTLFIMNAIKIISRHLLERNH